MRRCRVQARLPALGIRLGGISAEQVILGVGDYSGRDPPYCAYLVPVKRTEDGFALYRRRVDAEPAASADQDGPKISQVFLVERQKAARGFARREYDNVDHVVLPPPMQTLTVARSLWGDDELDRSQYGVMVLMIYLLVPTPKDIAADAPDRFAADIAKATDEILKNESANRIDLVVVPSDAVRGVDARSEDLRFALASCQYTLGMVDGSPVDLPAGPGDVSYDRLLARVRVSDRSRPQFAVLAGDQVYVDATAGLFDPTASRGRFRKPYEQFYGSRIVRDLQRRLRCYMVMDDHEVEDNWEDRDDRRLGPLLRRKGGARDAYVEYERGIGTLPQPDPPERLWNQVDIDGYDFFFADTRTERQTRTAAGLSRALIMSEEQHCEICKWLHKPANDGRPRFLVFSAMPFPRRLATAERPSAALRSDAWDGYPASLERLLDAVASAGRSNVICLSGDEHLSSVSTTTLTTETGTIKLHSIHCSGLYTPYPFANSIVEDFAPDGDDLRTQDKQAGPARHRAVVETKFFSGQGFCVISVKRFEADWRVHVDFHLLPSGGTHDFSLPVLS